MVGDLACAGRRGDEEPNIAFTAIAVINTLAISTGGRSREIALMRLAGATALGLVATVVPVVPARIVLRRNSAEEINGRQ